jgi:hypothetical protein
MISEETAQMMLDAELAQALARCAGKLKVEYDRQQPDAPADECWAEAEAAWALLDAFGWEPDPRAVLRRHRCWAAERVLDGRWCCICGKEGGAMVPMPRGGPRGQLFAHEACLEPPAS